MAELLNLDHPETYTGHCFRRTAATIAVDGGATTQQLQRAFGWKSVHTAQRYVDESSKGAKSMANILTNSMKNTAVFSTSSSSTGNESEVESAKIYHIHATGENNVYNFH